MSERSGGAQSRVESPDSGAHEGEVRVGELFHWLYRLFYSKVFGVLLILAFAAYAFVGSLVPQMSPEVHADASAHEHFLGELRPTLGPATNLLDALGLFHAFTSIGFLVVVTLLALSIIACTTHRIPELRDRVHRPRTHVAPRFFDRARYRAVVHTSASTDRALSQVRGVLSAKKWRLLEDPRDPERAVFADRFAWSGIGTVLAHTAFVLILIAFVVSSFLSVDENLDIPVGGSVEVGHDSGLTVSAVAFTDTYTPEGQAADYVSELSVTKGGTEVAHQEVRVNSPLVVDGFRFHQASFGHAVDLRATDASGRALYEGTVPLTNTTEDRSDVYGFMPLGQTGKTLVVATAASGQGMSTIPPGSALFEIHADTQSGPVASKQVTQGNSVEMEGITVTFQREREYTGITLRNDPGAPIMWVASVLLVGGTCITFLLQYRRLWVRVDEDDDGTRVVRLGSVSRLDVTFERIFSGLVRQVEAALPDTGGQARVDLTPDTDEEEPHGTR
ncbi:cytochrome c biogenesis protein ResB [Schaalia sp. 19OD2882]|uniref:cytochrome c biogenesis protein ResB n=1 Tax=Schaalia sp. 19OD2882 TaxID=2794089 RepID=UPI001C1F12D7|nr:cytochrome c biogenesis protein ResB [Schaalia sp. 19OD2882]QWW18894.1 cytochrome c biogenesis protein ResB [Schaalia sp. 19OD2882]